MAENFTRRDVAVVSGALVSALSMGTAGAGAAGRTGAREISHTSAAIHQEVEFKASAAQLYQALTVTEKFDKVVQLSAAMNSGMKKMLGTAPTAIDAQPGGAVSLFGGYVTGRFLELVTNARIVQAWRAGSWDAGQYSIATFVLQDHGVGAKLVFDHKGFPDAAAAHLAEGWHINYWQPLAKLLG